MILFQALLWTPQKPEGDSKKLEFLPMMDTDSEVGGRISVNCSINTDIDRRMVTPKVNFSPDSGGRVNPSSTIDDMIITGMIKLKP